MTLLQLQTETETYWTESFTVTEGDLEYLFSVFLEDETPLTSREIARLLVQYRAKQEAQTLRRQIEKGEIFQPKNSYSVGQQLVFPALNYKVGEVIAQRPGHNPEHGEFTVIQVDFGDGKAREYATALTSPHALNLDASPEAQSAIASEETIDRIMGQYGDDIIYLLEERLRETDDVAYFAGRWFLRSLLADVGIARLHLAEAVLVMHEGGPLDTPSIAKEVDLPQEVNARLQFSRLTMRCSMMSD